MNTNKPTVLIITKDPSSRGGVANYYNLFFAKVDKQKMHFERFDIGSRSKDYYRRQNRLIAYCFDYIVDIYRFTIHLKNNRNIRFVQLNPSLIPVPLLRDGLLLIISHFFSRLTIVFIRGWRDDIFLKISTSKLLKALFIKVFNKADRIIVLAEEFKNQLISIGVSEEKIIVSRTMFDGSLIKPRDKLRQSIPHFLFLSRISRKKGIFEIIEAAKHLTKMGLSFQITFHGHGVTEDTVSELKTRAIDLKVNEFIEIGDFLKEDQKYNAYAKADVFLLPSHHEGCPNSILEAMGSGCFIVCSKAGAMKEVVQNNLNGCLVQIQDPIDLAKKMAWIIQNIDIVRVLGEKNINYAFNHFESEKIIAQLTAIYDDILLENFQNNN